MFLSSSGSASSTARRRRSFGPISRLSIRTTRSPIKERRLPGLPATILATARRSATTTSRSIGILAGSGVNGIDADPALVIQDFLTNAQYGCGFNPASIDSGSLFTNPDSFRPIVARWVMRSRPRLTAKSRRQHPDALAADILDRGGMEWRSPQIHSLCRYGDLCRGKSRLSAPNFRSRSRSLCRLVSRCLRLITVAPPTSSSRMAASSTAISNIPFVFHRRANPSAAGEYGMTQPGLTFSGPPIRASQSSSPTPQGSGQISHRI